MISLVVAIGAAVFMILRIRSANGKAVVPEG
jgi:hypothetical protein